MARLTTFRIGGAALFLLTPRTEEDFAAGYRAAVRSGLPVYVLGGGSNVLVSDRGLRGVVISTRRLRDSAPAVRGEHVRVRAGTWLQGLVRWTASRGLAGLECLAGIPGTVGGAVRMNAGTASGTVGTCVGTVWCVGKDGRIRERSGADIAWGYRSTDVEDPIVAAEFVLERDRPAAILERRAAAMSERRERQPVRARSAGCFYRNPTGNSAGKLIDEAGLKGNRVGGAYVSRKHANFIVNTGGATATDVMTLCKRIRKRVRADCGVVLEPEVCRWPDVGWTGSEG
jgi:UDP-N-acetylmuramate dehydrogenase